MAIITQLPQRRARVCDACRRVMRKRVTSAERPYCYRESGLADASLIGITVYQCSGCLTETPVIPRIGALHRFITQTLLQRSGRLMGGEIRFLHHFTGKTCEELAGLIGVEPEHLSRVENSPDGSFAARADQRLRIVASSMLANRMAGAVELEMPANSREWQHAFVTDGTRWAAAAA